VQALRREVAELRQLVSETPDPGSEVAVQDNRRKIQEKAARQAKAIEAAEDPATLAELRSLETEEEVMSFLRDHGMEG
jgi:hypothetical protein